MKISYNQKFIDIIESSPHFLVAGCTGSGKSVLLNNFIINLSSRYNPNELDLYFIDLKRVEMSLYQNLAHTVKIAKTSEEAFELLQDISKILKARFQYMEFKKIRSFQGRKIYIFIDELADLMLTDKKRIEPLIQHIAQIGRAAQVHLILATQIIRADIITTKITGNVEGRISLRTKTDLDSRKIIGCDLAINLPKYGTAILQNVDGLFYFDFPYISESEVKAHVDKWKQSQNLIQKLKGLL